MILLAVKYVLSATAAFALAQQCRKPAWLPGRLFARSMNLSHSRLTKWGLSYVSIRPADTILDVGCGGGRTIAVLAAAASQGRVFGVDYSAASVGVARRLNARAIEAGRVSIQEGSVSALPFDAETFDLVTAVETHYYWPDFVNDMMEIRRTLKPLGRMVLIAETYRGQRADWIYLPVMRLLLRGTYLTPDEHRRRLEAAGYGEVEIHVERSKGWLCAVGRRLGGEQPLTSSESRDFQRDRAIGLEPTMFSVEADSSDSSAAPKPELLVFERT